MAVLGLSGGLRGRFPAGGFHQEVERALEAGGDFFGVVDEEVLENGLVHQASGLVVGFEVGAVEVADEGERGLEGGFDGLELDPACRDALLDSVEGAHYPILPGLEQIGVGAEAEEGLDAAMHGESAYALGV